MKKTLLTLALVMAVGFAGLNIAQAGYGPGGCNGPGGWAGETSLSYEEMNKFHNDNADLRKQMFDKRTEYYNAVNQENPDKELAQKLWGEMYDLQNDMHTKALAAGMMLGSRTRSGYGGHMMWW